VGESGHALLKRRPLPSASRYGLWIEVEMPQERPLAVRAANHLRWSEVRGLSSGPALLSGFDRLSAPDRRSPTSCFSTSDRVSVPERRSFELRLPSPDRFSSLPIVVSVGLPRIKLDRAGLSHESRP
jgi:hypothetical protein